MATSAGKDLLRCAVIVTEGANQRVDTTFDHSLALSCAELDPILKRLKRWLMRRVQSFEGLKGADENRWLFDVLQSGLPGSRPKTSDMLETPCGSLLQGLVPKVSLYFVF